MKRSISVVFVFAMMLAGCVSTTNTHDAGDKRNTVISYKHTVPVYEKQKVIEAYRKAFQCWAKGPENKQHLVLSSFKVVDDYAGRMKAVYSYPSKPGKVAVTFTVALGLGFWDSLFKMVTTGPERHSHFADYIISQHRIENVTLCKSGSLSIGRR